jgi:TRAP-type mannitol/chloroaromatic compound transport system permease large subunit
LPRIIGTSTGHSRLEAAPTGKDISLYHVFAGAFPFAAIMLLVLIVLIVFPGINLALL